MTVLNIDLSKVKLNLKIETVIYNFLLVLAVLEFSTNVSWAVSRTDSFPRHEYNISKLIQSIEVGSKHWIQDLVVIRFKRHTLLYLNLIQQSILLPIICLFLIVLRRMYLNLPYRNWIIGYSVSILARTMFFLGLMLHHNLHHLLEMLVFPIGLVDFVVYVVCCKKFYLLLKGRREEARWHLTQEEYHKRSRIAKQFLYSQTYTFLIYLILLTTFLISLVQTLTRFVLDISDSQSKVSSNPISIPTYCRKVLTGIYILVLLIQIFTVILLEVILALSYVMACIGIVWKLCRKRMKFNHVNDWVTKPLMERYRATLENPSSNRRQDLLSIR